ncbi:MAG: LytTR family DNA-binding domain-containing protein [Saprospiraceae bacterium]
MKAILIDDEFNCLEMLEWSLKQACPQIQILEKCSSGTAGINAIRSHKPDLIFLDIEMRDMTGFEMLQQLNGRPQVEVIFTTAYDQFAIEAFKVSAADYLLKPIDEADLAKAVQKVEKRKESQIASGQIEFLLNLIQNKSEGQNGTIAIPSSDGLEFIKIEDIIYCQADRNYTSLYFPNAKPMMVSKTLKDIEAMLPENQFFRVHHSTTVNLNHIKRYLKIDGGYLVMSNGEKVKVSRSKKELLMNRL